MAPVEFAIVGAGWRSEFFLRIAQALPERFAVTGVVVRDKAKGEAFERRFGTTTYRDLDTLLATTKPAFIVVSVPQPAAPGLIAEIASHSLPVLTETPPSPSLEGLLGLWSL